MILGNKVIYQDVSIRCFSDPEVCEAIKVANANMWSVVLSPIEWYERESRLKTESEEDTKSPGSSENRLREASSQFSDSLLDDQAKKVCDQDEKIKRLGKEISKLNSIIHDRNSVLSDVSDELRLTKIREKNLSELVLKYVGENDKLKKDLAEKVVCKIDAQALKSAESALAYKEKVIADLCNELSATKNELEEKTNLVEMVRKGSKEYREYGIEAVKMIRKMAKVIVSCKPVVSLEDFEEYRRLANGYSFNPQLPDFSEEEEKKLSLVREDSVGALTNRKNYSPFKDTHPAEESPDDVELYENLDLFVRL